MKPHKWAGGGGWGKEFSCLAETMAGSSYDVSQACVFKTEGGFCVICTDKTLLLELPLERWDKRCDILLRESATLPSRHFLKQKSIGHPASTSANLSWCAEKINKNCKTKPSATGGVWLFSWLVWSFQESISAAGQSKTPPGTVDTVDAVDAEAGSDPRGGRADWKFKRRWLFLGSRIAAC